MPKASPTSEIMWARITVHFYSIITTSADPRVSSSLPIKFEYLLDDLIRSGQGETVTNILIDLNGFWNYENREMYVTDNSDQDLSSSFTSS